MAEVEYGKITDEGLDKIRARIGQGLRGTAAVAHRGDARRDLPPGAGDRRSEPDVPRRGVRQEDALGHAAGAADHDPEHRHAARRRQRRPAGRACPGVHSIWSGSMYEYEQPLKLGDRSHSKSYLQGSARGGERLRRRPRRLPDLRGGRTGTRRTRRSACARTPGSATSATRRRRPRSTARPSSRSGRSSRSTSCGSTTTREKRTVVAQVGRRAGRRRAAAGPQGPAHADRRDRLRVVLRHLPGRQQGRRQPLPQAPEADDPQRAGRARAAAARALGQRLHHRTCSACPAPTTSASSAAPG